MDILGICFLALGANTSMTYYAFYCRPFIQRLGWTRASNEIGAGWYLAEALSLLTGVSVFVCRFPERLSPGTFDIWSHSHQLWHIFTVLGGAFHVVALVAAYNYRRMHKVC
ncbi:hypothetical protein N7495_002000 [Penicillium taxi]|uniref:uncharacterized protein n=1 Tax=Penicillium taxi TaxID=168475 RepID=UPI00254540A8|nr:uncharacterized protein N7495_002000 [Penicillium taxi]KAJ5901472.1 hypothetical protein N7495_002000 [Penicillium taxi]